jgi:three-Cys-motif partner protein
MSKDNHDFFKQKKIWSEVKDELLGCYLVPYFNKILSIGKPVLYVDCFAGKGKFEDGKPGSPLTALQSLDASLSVNHGSRAIPTVSMKFIELNHSKDLALNLPAQHRSSCEVIGGKFEENIIPILRKAKAVYRRLNVFLYIDPYGVKVLNAKLFDSVAEAFDTAELLINLNSFGFIREACRVKKVYFRELQDEVLSDLEEYDSSILNSAQELNDIAGGDYWQAIIDNYNNSQINCYQAEKDFSHRYKLRLRQKYKYVLDMPIRLKQEQHPKYRMVHATNHHDGCIIMADNIAKRTDRLVIEIQNAGQLSLFEQNAENEMINDDILISKINEMLETTNDYIRLNKFLASFYNEYGVLCKQSRISSGSNSILKAFEKDGIIDVKRTPATTETGKPSTSWQDGKGHTVELRKRG